MFTVTLQLQQLPSYIDDLWMFSIKCWPDYKDSLPIQPLLNRRKFQMELPQYRKQSLAEGKADSLLLLQADLSTKELWTWRRNFSRHSDDLGEYRAMLLAADIRYSYSQQS